MKRNLSDNPLPANINEEARRFSMRKVYRMLRNPLYAGLVKHNDKTFSGEHEIIAPEEWHQIQASLKDNQRRKGGDNEARINSPLQDSGDKQLFM